MKKLIIFSALYLCSFGLFGQANKILDSLKIELAKKQADTSKVKILNDLAYYYLYQDIDSSLVYGKKALLKAKSINFSKVEANACIYIGNAFLYTNKYDSAHYYYDLSLKLHDKYGINKSALYASLGLSHKIQGNYEKAIETYLEGIKYDESNAYEYGKFIKACNLINIYAIVEDYQKSIDFGVELVEVAKSTDDENIKYFLGTLLNNIGTYYSKLHDFDNAIYYFNESLEANLENGNKKEIARNYNNLGSIYEKTNRYSEAKTLLEKALEIRKEFSDQDELAETHTELGVVYSKLNNIKLSNIHFKKALKIAEDLKSLTLLSDVYLAKSKAYESQQNFKSALLNFEKHTQFRDSILHNEKLKNIEEIETKYQTEKKDKEIATQQLELKEKESEIQKKKAQNNYMLGGIIFLVVSTILLVFLLKQRQRRKNQELLTLKREFQIKTLESLIEGEEKERFRIAKELHDGVNGDLSAIKYKLSSLLEMNNKVIKEAITMIDDSCKQVRAISHNLVPPTLEKFNLVEATEAYCNNINTLNSTLEITFQQLGDTIEIPKQAEVNIFRIIQELITNSVKHAKASTINVQISNRNSIIQVTVEDDGIGFDKNNPGSSGIGLSNVQSRIDYLQAEVDLVTNEKGTSYTIDIDKEKLNDN
ncbi:tetratricopeptide repeat protein [Cognatitamlana onchidii]|uniref:tetratricopeptide repeat protein n=1 Tax=Cognatitamlana onchidii TaxID=2562860 RepID=UPI0010A62A9C|nr:tetratricopeptide repeat protein [Algibacter onchidii]